MMKRRIRGRNGSQARHAREVAGAPPKAQATTMTDHPTRWDDCFRCLQDE